MNTLKIKTIFYQASSLQWSEFCGALRSRCQKISEKIEITPNYMKVVKDKTFIDSGLCIYGFVNELIDGHAVQKLSMNEFDVFYIINIHVKVYGITVALMGQGNVHVYGSGKAKIEEAPNLVEMGETFNVSIALSAHLDYSNDIKCGDELGYHVSIPIGGFSLEEKKTCLEYIERFLKMQHKENQDFLLVDCVAIELWVEND